MGVRLKDGVNNRIIKKKIMVKDMGFISKKLK